MKIVYMGTPEFAVYPLIKIYNAGYDIRGIVTQPDRKKGRGEKMIFPPVKDFAVKENIPYIQPDKIKGNEEFLNRLKEWNPDVIVVTAFGKILPSDVLNLPPMGCVNIHASLLPRWRGASPIQHAILYGDEKTGISIMKMDEGLDTGDIILSEGIMIGDMNYTDLSEKLSKLGGELIIDALKELDDGRASFTKQSEDDVTYAGLIEKAHGYIDFSKENADAIKRKIRAFTPWPSVYTTLKGETVKFISGNSMKIKELDEIDIKTGDSNWDEIPYGGIVFLDNSGIYIKAKDSIFKLMEIQLPGKKPMDVSSYLRGHSLDFGTVFGG